jgi:hypothetical protein
MVRHENRAANIARGGMAEPVNRVVVILGILGVALLSAGCARTNEWQEEVQLRDGDVLVIERRVRYRAPSGALGQPIGRQAIEERLTFSDPSTGRSVEWFEPRHEAKWLDRVDGQLWLVAMLTTPCESGFGHLPAWKAFSLRGERWIAAAADTAPEVSLPNLLTSDYPVTRHVTYVSLVDKNRLNRAYLARPRKGPIDFTVRPKC